jgi:hypothetical protein
VNQETVRKIADFFASWKEILLKENTDKSKQQISNETELCDSHTTQNSVLQ